MSVWARNKQRRLVRVIPQRHPEESTVRRLFQENPNPQMEHLGNQQTLFNSNDQGLPGNPQRPYEPPRQGDGVALPATPAKGGGGGGGGGLWGNINIQKNQYQAPPTPLPNVERTLQDSATSKDHNKLMYSIT